MIRMRVNTHEVLLDSRGVFPIRCNHPATRQLVLDLVTAGDALDEGYNPNQEDALARRIQAAVPGSVVIERVPLPSFPEGRVY